MKHRLLTITAALWLLAPAASLCSASAAAAPNSGTWSGLLEHSAADLDAARAALDRKDYEAAVLAVRRAGAQARQLAASAQGPERERLKADAAAFDVMAAVIDDGAVRDRDGFELLLVETHTNLGEHQRLAAVKAWAKNDVMAARAAMRTAVAHLVRGVEAAGTSGRTAFDDAVARAGALLVEARDRIGSDFEGANRRLQQAFAALRAAQPLKDGSGARG